MPTSDKILSVQELSKILTSLKNEGKKIAFTNGCFDILHLGHIDYLEKAKAKADVLVVGLNSDDSVKKIKGENRPINNQLFRSRMLASLAFVDYVVLFGEDTPLQLIEKLLPDVLIKGNDYLAENIVGADVVKQNGGKVETIELVEGYSTTKLIEKIKNI